MRPPPPGVAIVSLDARPGERPVVGRGARRWSRRVHAAVIERLDALGASVVVLDVAFEAASDEAADAALEEALSRSGRVVLFQRLSRVAAGDVPVPPLPRFASAARALGVFPLPKLPERVEWYWPFFRALEPTGTSGEYTLRALPSLPVTALQLHVRNLPDPLAASLGARLLALPTTGTLHLNFYGPTRTIATIEHHDLLDATSERADAIRGAVAGGVVFVGHSGRSAVDQLDGFRTVYSRDDGVDLSGVEIAATAFANLLDGSVPHPLPASLTVLVHVLLGVAASLLALHAGAVLAVASTVALALGHFALSVHAFGSVYRLLPIGVPLLVLLPLVLFFGLLRQHLHTRSQRDRYHRGARLLLPATAVRGIESDRVDQAGAERLHGTCMITDAAGYTRVSESLAPERLAALSREYFALLTEQVRLAGGELIDLEGDSMTAVWATPEPMPDTGARAAGAALGIARAVERFDARHPDTPLPTRIGLHAGWMASGRIGGGESYRHRVVGDVVNTALAPRRAEPTARHFGPRDPHGGRRRADAAPAPARHLRPERQARPARGRRDTDLASDRHGARAHFVSTVRRGVGRARGWPARAGGASVRRGARDVRGRRSRTLLRRLLTGRGLADARLDERGVVRVDGK